MPRYYFHRRDNREWIDKDGVDLAGPIAARTLAVVSSGEAIRDFGERFWDNPNWEMWVTSESGATICALRFAIIERK